VARNRTLPGAVTPARTVSVVFTPVRDAPEVTAAAAGIGASDGTGLGETTADALGRCDGDGDAVAVLLALGVGLGLGLTEALAACGVISTADFVLVLRIRVFTALASVSTSAMPPLSESFSSVVTAITYVCEPPVNTPRLLICHSPESR
jgi:hypothetical protein